MDFDERRLNCPGLSEEYLESELKRKGENTLSYIVSKYDGSEFIVKCYEAIYNKVINETEQEKFEKMMSQGLRKEGLCYKMMDEAGSFYLVSERNRIFFKKRFDETEWDVTNLLDLDGQQFVSQCYEQILDRRPDEAGYINYCKALCDGTPKEVIIYMLAASNEARRIRKTKNLECYQAVYDSFMNRSYEENRISKFDKLKWPIRNYPITKQIEQTLLEMCLKDDYRHEQITECLHHLMEQNNILLTRTLHLEEEIDKLKH